MIVVRDVFRLKFGKAREALAAWKEMGEYMKGHGFDPSAVRILTDLVAPYYTLVMETTVPTLAEWEAQGRKAMSDPNWRKMYDKLVPLVESGYREVFTIVQ
jgi:hypothetical protein